LFCFCLILNLFLYNFIFFVSICFISLWAEGKIIIVWESGGKEFDYRPFYYNYSSTVAYENT
jgi:hypothetical protein